jgi:prepilin-type N-terminal cleavage/methylation domain-containing protein/prepilin-type processing-associated H-X9-DG protein
MRIETGRGKLRQSTGFTLIEVLLAIAIIGLLISLTIPAVQAAREASRRASCMNNLRQYGTAMYGVEGSHGRFPSGLTARITGPLDREGSLWAIHNYMSELLPFLEVPGAETYDSTVMFNDERNRHVIGQQIAIGTCPSSPLRERDFESTLIPSAFITKSVREHKLVAPIINYLDSTYTVTCRAGFSDYTVLGGADSDVAEANGFTNVNKASGLPGMFPFPVADEAEAIEAFTPALFARETIVISKGIRTADIWDGLANTIMVAEIAGRPQHWINGKRTSLREPIDRPWADPRSVQQLSTDGVETRLIQCNNHESLYSFHPQGVNLLFADGHAELVAQSVGSEQILHWMCPDEERKGQSNGD